MIENDLQYSITNEEAERFEVAIREYMAFKSDLHPRLRQGVLDGMQSILDELREEMADYKARQRGKATA
ncbi:MAG: hypothetical protein NTZ05_12055 [Chloroflexi bacterium]|nr:hypothetical protein [Chloroflexota bacterium]